MTVFLFLTFVDKDGEKEHDLTQAQDTWSKFLYVYLHILYIHSEFNDRPIISLLSASFTGIATKTYIPIYLIYIY